MGSSWETFYFSQQLYILALSLEAGLYIGAAGSEVSLAFPDSHFGQQWQKIIGLEDREPPFDRVLEVFRAMPLALGSSVAQLLEAGQVTGKPQSEFLKKLADYAEAKSLIEMEAKKQSLVLTGLEYEEFANLLDLLGLAVSAGMNLSGAMVMAKKIIRTPKSPLLIKLFELEPEQLREMNLQTRDPFSKVFAGGTRVLCEMGGNLVEIYHHLASSMRKYLLVEEKNSIEINKQKPAN